MGSGEELKSNHAALAVDGWRNNPDQVTIDKVVIKSSKRHGVYLTGFNHSIGEVDIHSYGTGSSKNMSPMQDSRPGEEKDITALWINRCYNSYIGKVAINENQGAGTYTLFLDEGNLDCPVIIDSVEILGNVVKTKMEKSRGVKINYINQN